MDAITPVKITTPDGVERELRSTLGARKRIAEHFGMSLPEALKKYQDGAIPGILHAMLHDENGAPPPFSVQFLEEHIPADQAPSLLAAIMSAATNGRTPKNVLEELLVAQIRQEMGIQTGVISSDFAPNSSDSLNGSSGGDISNAKSSPESTTTNSESESSITEAA